MKSTAFLVSLSLLSLPACSKKKDKVDGPETATKTVEAAASASAPTVPKVNPKFDALAAKFDGLEDRLDALDYKSKAFEAELVATYGPVTTTLEGESSTRFWIDCDGNRCVGASMTLADDPKEVDSFDRIDETKEQGYYYGFAYLAWRAANPDASLSTTMKPKELESLGDKLYDADALSWNAALKELEPAGKSVKYPDDEDYFYWHAVDAKSCTAIGLTKYSEGEKGPELDGVDIQDFEASDDPLSNDEYARCAMYALGI